MKFFCISLHPRSGCLSLRFHNPVYFRLLSLHKSVYLKALRALSSWSISALSFAFQQGLNAKIHNANAD
jgi:hypothetical protein